MLNKIKEFCKKSFQKLNKFISAENQYADLEFDQENFVYSLETLSNLSDEEFSDLIRKVYFAQRKKLLGR